MRRHILAAIIMLPLLLNLGQAAQKWTVDSSQIFGIPSEDSDTNSYLGVDIANITTDRLGALKLKEEQGVEVTMVDQDAPAGKAGIKEHDVILTMNGTAIESKTQLQRMIHETPPGRVITLGLSRDGQPMTIKVQLADRRNEFALLGPKGKYDKDKYFKDKDFHVEIPPIPNLDFDIPNIGVVYVHSSMRSGVMVENLTPQLGEFFGAKNGNGVLVRSVEKGSRAEKAGLRAGDVITRLGDQPIHDTSDFTHALHSQSAGSVSVGVIRDKKEQTLTLTLPERKDSGELIEESLEEPELDAENQLALSEVQSELAKLRPQMELAKDMELSKAMELAKEESRKASEEVRKSLCAQQKEMKEQAEKLRQELGPKVQEELKKGREKLQQQMEELRLQMRGGSLDI
jgi:predicted metalloprotease with PDZ domain